MASATGSGSHVNARSVSRSARLTALTPPSSLTRRFFRVSPSPAIPSSALDVIRLLRRSPWKLLAKRCASSRIRCSMNSASLPRGISTGSERPGTNTSSNRLARPATGISCSNPRSRTTRSATAT